MHITLTGSVGRIGKPLAQRLVAAGHEVSVISSSPARATPIVALGAKPLIGRLQDASFLTSAFAGADAVYTMAPPADYFDHDLDLLGYYRTLGASFAEAIRRAGAKRVVNLSSIGAHLSAGNGILLGTHHVERLLDALPAEVDITHVRPTEIYYNLYAYVDLIREHGIIASNVRPDVVNAWVAPADIAAAVADALTGPPAGRSVRYVTSEELTFGEVARTLGEAIGRPDLAWVPISDEQMVASLAGAGMQPSIAAGMAEMYAAIRTGELYGHYRQHPPSSLGEVKVSDFAEEFARAYRTRP